MAEVWPKVSRNAQCPCGSGEKYKRCCGAKPANGVATGKHGMPGNGQAAQMQLGRGVQALRSGRPQEAIPYLIEAASADATNFEAHHALGAALLQLGRVGDATTVLLRAVTLRPDSAPAWRDLASAYDRQTLHEPAIGAYRRALDLAPQSGDLLLRLAQLYIAYSRQEEASACYECAAELKPETIQARLFRSDARLLVGDIPGAEHWAREALAQAPDSAAAHATLAGLLYAQGRFDEAAKAFEESLRLNPNEGRCWIGLADCRKYSAEDSSIVDRMRAVLARDALNNFNRTAVQFALGKLFDDMGDYAHAMEQFDAANLLRSQDMKFDRAGFEAMIDQTIQRFSPAFIASAAGLATQDARPLFVVGMYRSGTTLVEQIISSHPGIAAGGELSVWMPGDIDLDLRTGQFDPVRARAAIAKYLSVLDRKSATAARVTDKLPFNCLRLGAIHALMPNARIIHCVRDPIDTCLSIYSNLLKSRVSFAARKDDLAFCYRQYLRVMEHWRNVLPPQCFMEVEYERLIADREAETRRLIAFTGLDWNDACLRPDENKRAIDTASAWQARQPVYATSVQRWRHYEPWLGELRELLPSGAG